MCGILGVWAKNLSDISNIREMRRQIEYRGPDSSGEFFDENNGLVLSHVRLSILDLTSAGSQPMVSNCGNYILIFNGEIYNHLKLREIIKKNGFDYKWNGSSDTETLLVCIKFWGIEKTLSKISGMFAFAFWDKSNKKLFLARDRIGEKPLFYGKIDGAFVFASELKALCAHPRWRGDIDRDALAQYIRHGYIHDPHCIYKNFYKLSPGYFIEIDDKEVARISQYWSLKKSIPQNRKDVPYPQFLEELEHKITLSLQEQSRADVPLGAFLSGGIDSSLLVALMQKNSSKNIKTFTIGYESENYNEANHARKVAKYLGTEHVDLLVNADDALSVIPDLPKIWDEPFADSSQIPTLLVSKLARESVKVAISGDGGDEIFCGYNRYKIGYGIYRSTKYLPSWMVSRFSKKLQSFKSGKIERLVSKFPQKYRYKVLSDRLVKLGHVLEHTQDIDYYKSLVSVYPNPQEIVRDCKEKESLLANSDKWPNLSDFREMMMYLDTMTYLPGDILTKTDRASMSVGLELRAPFLSHEIIEYAWQMPLSYKLQRGQTKAPLRDILYTIVPKEIVDRPKMGFGVPIEDWLNGPLRDWVEDLLDYDRLENEGFFHAKQVRKMWEHQLSGERRWHHQIWALLMFQSWLDSKDKIWT
tara:strand:- start:9020 stop:10948 length:1929 start_codon:yes stop_codon:yes gene_type:complete